MLNLRADDADDARDARRPDDAALDAAPDAAAHVTERRAART